MNQSSGAAAGGGILAGLRRVTKLFSCCLVVAGIFLVAVIGAVVALYAWALRFPNAPQLQEQAGATGALPATSAQTLDGFDSPYLGHTGSWDGKGGGMFGSSKVPSLDQEVAMGLRWTFMAVYWSAMEPEGPVDLSGGTPPAWRALDAFVVAAYDRHLNILMQAPVMGGNAGGPPDWAGVREEGKSAPQDMDGAAAFAGRLVERYRPGGTLALREGWGDTYGVRAWELDNEPDSYFTHWKGQAGDYAEFVSKVAARIKEIDSEALVLTPAVAAGARAARWTEEALGLHGLVGSPAYVARGKAESIGPWTDVISFHIYKGMDTVFSGTDRIVGMAQADTRAPFDAWQKKTTGVASSSLPCWHTEGNFDFLGLPPQALRAAWRFQFFARGFAAGVAKLCVMDASEGEQTAVRRFIAVLPDPFPMYAASKEVEVVQGAVQAFRHTDREPALPGHVWVVWAENGTQGATVRIPVGNSAVLIHHVDGTSTTAMTESGKVELTLPGGERISPPVLVEDRAK